MTAAQSASRVVGRDAELSTLADLLGGDGETRALVLVGEAFAVVDPASRHAAQPDFA